MNLEALAMVLFFILVVCVAGVLLYVVPSIIIFWKLVTKAGQPGWSQLIPLYNSYICGVVAKKPAIGIAVAACGALQGITSYASVLFPESSSLSQATSLSTSLLGLIWLVAWLVLLFHLIKQYDAGVGMWLLFIFLPVVGVFLVHKVNYTGGQITDLAARVPVSQPASSVVEPKDQQVATTVLSSSESVSSEQPRT